MKKTFGKMGVDIGGYIPKKLADVDENNEDDFVLMYSVWFIQKKVFYSVG